MFASRIEYALKNFIEENYFTSVSNNYTLEEAEASGKSILQVNVTGNNLCISGFDRKNKCSFLKQNKKYGMQKSIDHIILQQNEGKWNAHLIEMKTSVGTETWKGIKLKVRTSYLTIQAISVFLGIKIENFFIYTTYEQEKFESVQGTVDPRVHIPILGEKAPNFKKEEWDAEKIRIKIDELIELPHKAVRMTRTGPNTSTDTLIPLRGDLTI